MKGRRFGALVATATIAALVIFVVPGFAHPATSVDRWQLPTYRVSWNPAVASQFHAPLSSMGLIGVTHGRPADGNPGLQARTIQTFGAMGSNAIRFTNDLSYMPMSETTITLNPANTSQVVGGVNDARFFFCPALPSSHCPSGWEPSLSGFMVSANGGASLLKTGDLPGVSDPFTPSGYLTSWGDPSVAFAPGNVVYYASLALDPAAGANIIELSASNSNLWKSGVSCVTAVSTPTTNPCWSSVEVFGNLSANATTFEDKELISVDWNTSSLYYGDAYVAWDHFTAVGTSESYLARCNPALSCVMLAGGPKPVFSGGDPFAAFTTPSVDARGGVHVTYCNFGTTTTVGPVTCHVRNSGTGGTSFGKNVTVFSFEGAGTMMPKATAISGFATEQFRIAQYPAFAADTSGKTKNVYWAMAVCSSPVPYYGFAFPAIPGNCATSAVVFLSSTNNGLNWSAPKIVSKPAVNDQPWLTVDPSNGTVVLTYYTAQFDPWNHRIDVIAQDSTNGGTTWKSIRMTTVSNEPNDDPGLFDYFAQFGGAFSVPQIGDYFQSVAWGGKIWSLFSANYGTNLGVHHTNPYLVTASE